MNNEKPNKQQDAGGIGRVIVTGGARGIGYEIVRTLAAKGYHVALTYRRSSDQAADQIAGLSEEFPRQEFRAYELDLADGSAVDQFANDLIAWDDLYAFVHNAGATYDSLAATVSQDRLSALMQVNMASMSRLAAAALRPMMRARRGRIVAIGSIASLRGSQGNASYAATKGAISSYLRTLAIEVAGRGITANTIAPGYVDTEMIAPYRAHREQIERQIPARRFGSAGEIAGLVGYLLTPEAAYITGNTIEIDGGLTAAMPVVRP